MKTQKYLSITLLTCLCSPAFSQSQTPQQAKNDIAALTGVAYTAAQDQTNAEAISQAQAQRDRDQQAAETTSRQPIDVKQNNSVDTQELAQNIKDGVAAVVSTLASVYNESKDELKDKVEEAKETAYELAKEGNAMYEESKKAVKNKTQEVATTAKDKTQEVASAAKNNAHQVASTAKDASGQAAHTIKDSAHAAKTDLDGFKGAVKEGFSYAVDKACTVYEKAGEKLKEGAEHAQDVAKTVALKGKEVYENSVHKIKEGAESAQEMAKGVISHNTDIHGNAVEVSTPNQDQLQHRLREAHTKINELQQELAQAKQQLKMDRGALIQAHEALNK